MLLRLGLDLGRGAGHVPSRCVVTGGVREGVPCGGERLGDVGCADGHHDGYGHVLAAFALPHACVGVTVRYPYTAGRGQAGRRGGQGSRAIVTGKLRQRSYETKEGEKRTV